MPIIDKRGKNVSKYFKVIATYNAGGTWLDYISSLKERNEEEVKKYLNYIFELNNIHEWKIISITEL